METLLLVAILANLFLLASSSGSSSKSSSSSYSSSSSGGSSSSASSFSSSGSHPPPSKPPCETTQPPLCTTCRKPNEVYDPCIAPCPPRRCDVDERLIKCGRPNPKDPCVAGCRCADGYYSNGHGLCVTRKDCPSCDGPNEHYNCSVACDNVCSTLHKQSQTNCPIKNILCNNMCYCNEGYARDRYNICIPIEQCNVTKCDCKHEVYSECIQGECRPKYCSELGFSIACPRIDPKYCKKGCLCKVGYVRDKHDHCIPLDQCPSCGGDPNAQSGCGKNCGRYCSNYDSDDEAVCTQECKLNGCDCRKHYVYDQNTEMCVLPKHCTTCRKPNEVYDPCIAPCPPRRCDVDERLIKCGRPNPKDPCVAGCRCADGYYSNGHGLCVTRKDCPSCDGPNEHYNCSVACDNVCSTLHKQSQTNCPIKNILCNNMCYCNEGYARDRYNICIPIEQCNVTKCDCKHEVYSECIQGECRPKYCSELGFSIACPRIDPKYCKKGCLCKVGYVRDKHDHCIPLDQCPSCGGDPNAQSGCGKNCGRYCSNYDSDDEAVCTQECKLNGCDCRKHYVYDQNTEMCVLPKHCTPVCRQDEVYSDCVNNACPIRNCSLVGITIDCIKTNPKHCVKGCLCKDPLMRENDGSCVPIAKCRSPVCKIDEVYSDCINGGCTRKNCSQIGQPVPCIKMDPKYCIKGCLCEQGYLRNDKGICVPENDCKPNCNQPNEYYETCDSGCPPQTCDSLDKAYACPIRDGDTCKGRCKCTKGHYRNIIGQCITKEQCQRCMGPHEYYSCGGACDNKCESLKIQNQTSCPIVNIKCNEKCYCENGYARAMNDTCIPINRCNETQCGKYERYEKCPAWSCEPQKCCDLGNPISCPDIPACRKCPVEPACICIKGYVRNNKGQCVPVNECPKICKGRHEVYEDCKDPSCSPMKCSELGFPLNCTYPPSCNKGCICKSGYVWDHRGVCIRIKHCPSCNGDKNAESGCGENCLNKCYDLQNPDNPRECPLVCQINGCDCREKYYLDENTNTCVLPKDCTQACHENEVYDACVNGGCGHRNCSQLGGPILCIDPIECKRGCTCKKNYLRDDKTGECVPEDKCPAKCSGDHEYFSCGPECDNVCSDLKTQSIENCPIKNKRCVQKCYCEDDYARNKNGDCIPIDECPESCNKPNEEYVQCPPTCPPQTCESLNKTYHCPLIKTKIDPSDCVGACRCIDGFYRNLIGECIRKKDCLKCTDDHEYFSCGPECDNVCCDLHKQSKDKCPIQNIECVKKCYCEDGYARNKDGDCIPIDECPDTCNKPNEEYVQCPPTCPPQTCESLNKTYHCPMIKTKIDPSDCVGACRCIDGFYRNLIGECIRKKDCLECTGFHEYFSCGPECDNVCCELDTQSKDNCPIKNIQCVRKCYCENGYARDKDDDCIPVEDCPGREPPVNGTVALAKLQYGNTQFTMNVLNQLLDSRPGESFMFSTISICIALAQIALYAIGTAAEQLFALLNLDNNEEIRAAFPLLIDSYKDQKDVILELAIKYYGNINIRFSKSFVKDGTEFFESDSEIIDFRQNTEAANNINAWVFDKTHGSIKDLVTADMFSALTEVAIFNCLYFKGNWEHQFQPDNTESKDFYLNDDDIVQVKTMYQKNTFWYAENDDLDCQILKLLYKGGEFSLLIYLPRSKTGLKSLTEKLLDHDTFAKSKESLKRKQVKAYIPLIDMTTSISKLQEILKMNKVTEIFESDHNVIKGIFEDDIPLKITDAIQKTAFKCDETGSEAAAATGIIVSTTAVQQDPTVFNWNHPAAFFLQSGDDILFSGVYAGQK